MGLQQPRHASRAPEGGYKGRSSLAARQWDTHGARSRRWHALIVPIRLPVRMRLGKADAQSTDACRIPPRCVGSAPSTPFTIFNENAGSVVAVHILWIWRLGVLFAPPLVIHQAPADNLLAKTTSLGQKYM